MSEILGTIDPPIRVELVADASQITRGLTLAGGALTRVAAAATFIGTVLADAVVRGLQRLRETVKGLVDGTSELSEKLSDDTHNAVTLLGNALARISDALLNGIAEILDRLLPSFARLIAEISKVDENSKAAKFAIETFIVALKSVLSIGVVLKGFIEAAAAVVTSVWHAASEAFRGEWTKAMDALINGAIDIGAITNETIGLLGQIWLETRVTADEAGPRLQRATDDVIGSLRAFTAAGRRVFEATRTPVEALAERMRRLGVLLDAGVIDQDTFARAAERARAVVSQTHKVLRDVAGAFERAFVDAVTGVKRLSEVLRDLLNDLAKIYLRAAFRQILFSVFGNNPAFSGLFGGGLFANAAGGLYKVAGAGGVDSQVVALRASPGENVAVWRGDAMGGEAAPFDVVVHDHHGVDVVARTLPGGVTELTIYDKQRAVHG